MTEQNLTSLFTKPEWWIHLILGIVYISFFGLDMTFVIPCT